MSSETPDIDGTFEERHQYSEEVRARLNEICEEDYGGNKAMMARAVGLERTRFTNILNGATNRIASTILHGLVKEGYNPEWLKTGKGDMQQKTPPTQDEQAGLDLRESDFSSEAIKEYATTIPIANGGDMDTSPQSSVVVDKRELSRYNGHASEICRTYMPGDAMKGKIEPGMPVDVRPLSKIDNPGIYVILHDDREMVIRIQPVGGNGYYLRYENAAYEDELLLPDEDGQLVSQITGRPVDLKVKYEVTASVQMH